MRRPRSSVNRSSLAPWPFVLALAAASASTACIIEHHHHDDEHENDPHQVPLEEPLAANIDTDRTIEVTAGEGVGLFVEYAAGGSWRLRATCDTATSGALCAFDVYASVEEGGELVELSGEQLDGSDLVEMYAEGLAHLMCDVGADFDGMRFKTNPGAIVRLETYLDGASEPRFVYWFGDGVLHTGAPTNPVDLVPTTP